MALGPEHLDYPRRRHGMDHDHYDWSMLEQRPRFHWPGDRPLALWINVAVQWFPLNQKGDPFPPPGGMSTPYPDLRHYTLRDYGNRVGIFRLLKALNHFGMQPSFAISAALVERIPWLVERLAGTGGEILCHGLHMDALHHGGLEEEQERELVERSLELLRKHTGQPVTGWLGPARCQSKRTPELLRAAGVQYMADWVNDELPYRFRTGEGELVALPLPLELEDQFILQRNLHSETEYADQLIDAFDFLHQEAADRGARLLALNLHPWLTGQPHRIGQLERLLAHIADHSGVWNASGAALVTAWQDCAQRA